MDARTRRDFVAVLAGVGTAAILITILEVIYRWT